MAIDIGSQVHAAVQALIDAERVPGGLLASLQAVGTVQIPASKAGNFPYLIFSQPAAELEFVTAESNFHRATINIDVYDQGKQDVMNTMLAVKGVLEPSFYAPDSVSAEVLGQIQLWDVVETDTTASRLSDRVWRSRWTVDIHTNSPR